MQATQNVCIIETIILQKKHAISLNQRLFISSKSRDQRHLKYILIKELMKRKNQQQQQQPQRKKKKQKRNTFNTAKFI